MIQFSCQINRTLVQTVETVSRKFKFESPYSGNSEVYLNPNGESYIRITTGGVSEHSIKRMYTYKLALEKLNEDMENAYKKQTESFTMIYKNMVKPHKTEYYVNNKTAPVLQRYKRNTFTIKQPASSDVAEALKNEALHIFYGKAANSDEVRGFVSSNLQQMTADRVEKWNEAQQLFNQIEDEREKKANSKYQSSYETEIKRHKDFIDGADDVVQERLERVIPELNMPYNINVNFRYLKEKALLKVELICQQDIAVPLLKANVLANGKLSVKEKSLKDSEQEKADTMAGILYYISSVIFDNVPSLQIIRTSLLNNKREGYIWVQFNRRDIMGVVKSSLVPSSDIFNYPNVIKVKHNRGSIGFEPIDSGDFKAQIEEVLSEIEP